MWGHGVFFDLCLCTSLGRCMICCLFLIPVTRIKNIIYVFGVRWQNLSHQGLPINRTDLGHSCRPFWVQRTPPSETSDKYWTCQTYWPEHFPQGLGAQAVLNFRVHRPYYTVGRLEYLAEGWVAEIPIRRTHLLHFGFLKEKTVW